MKEKVKYFLSIYFPMKFFKCEPKIPGPENSKTFSVSESIHLQQASVLVPESQNGQEKQYFKLYKWANKILCLSLKYFLKNRVRFLAIFSLP